MNIACGITTAPRRVEYLSATLQSLAEAGFEQADVFAEPDSPMAFLDRQGSLGGIRVEAHRNQDRRGNYRNWVESARRMLKLHPNSFFFLMAEDDVQFSRSCLTRAYSFLSGLDASDIRNFGFFSFYTPSHYQMEFQVLSPSGEVIGRFLTRDVAESFSESRPGTSVNDSVFAEGFYKPEIESLFGALALLFTRESLEDLLQSDSVTLWKDRYRHLPSEEIACIDTCIGEAMLMAHKDMWYSNPGLAQHVGEVSSIGPDRPISHLRRSMSVAE